MGKDDVLATDCGDSTRVSLASGDDSHSGFPDIGIIGSQRYSKVMLLVEEGG